VHNIGTDLSKGIYDLLPKPAFEFGEVEELSQTAHEWYKEKKFRPSAGERLTGFAPTQPVYNY
jgi:catalase